MEIRWYPIVKRPLFPNRNWAIYFYIEMIFSVFFFLLFCFCVWMRVLCARLLLYVVCLLAGVLTCIQWYSKVANCVSVWLPEREKNEVKDQKWHRRCDYELQNYLSEWHRVKKKRKKHIEYPSRYFCVFKKWETMQKSQWIFFLAFNCIVECSLYSVSLNHSIFGYVIITNMSMFFLARIKRSLCLFLSKFTQKCFTFLSHSSFQLLHPFKLFRWQINVKYSWQRFMHTRIMTRKIAQFHSTVFPNANCQVRFNATDKSSELNYGIFFIECVRYIVMMNMNIWIYNIFVGKSHSINNIAIYKIK